MAVDEPVPLATRAVLEAGAFADLTRSFDPDYVDRVMIRATRACETESSRRLAPFTLTESHRAAGVDPDEFSGGMDVPMDLVGTVGRSYADALGSTSLVRHVWLNEHAPVFPDLWEYTDVRVQVVRSYGGSEVMQVSDLEGPEPDTGHLWFKLGRFVPVGSLIRITYGGGYRRAIPADLEQACVYMAAGILSRELDPMTSGQGRSPDALEALAISWLRPYLRA